jgi:hypothetical protein
MRRCPGLAPLEELVFAYSREMGATHILDEPQRPAGYEETGFVTRDIPGVGVSVFSSPAPGHSYDPSARYACSAVPRY